MMTKSKDGLSLARYQVSYISKAASEMKLHRLTPMQSSDHCNPQTEKTSCKLVCVWNRTEFPEQEPLLKASHDEDN